MGCVFGFAKTAKNCIYPLARNHKMWYIIVKHKGMGPEVHH